ncbi:SGNH/GDSL hydrolase family protein [Catenuloplanes japonicus]|uniref:SGNH/GDSL hydrolase family protein n=1 Tax=Catenuloplanes japonicus TaxID=33876 RepID=UPI0012F9CC6D|nr:SGNH/GDSL hydrolase family protein [Catenuloplanes japonicus]
MSGILRTAAAVSLVVLAGAPAPASAAASALPMVDFVALGDSYAAGVGAGTPLDACRNTAGAYSRLWTATDPGLARLTTATCSGAKTADVLAAAAALTGETDLVSITVGANDLGVTGAFAVCLDPARAADCAAAQARIEEALQSALPSAVGTVLTTVKERAPQAKVVLTGYPQPFSVDGDCGTPDIPAEIRGIGNRVMGGLNTVLAAQAKLAGIAYVDVEPAFTAHEICSTTPWVAGFEGQADGTILHPNPAGQAEGYLPLFTKAVGTPQDVAQWITERDGPASPPPSGTVTPGPSESAIAAPGSGGGGGTLPLTGPDVVMEILAGLALVSAGAAIYLLARRLLAVGRH